uniref:Threonylcarbamoyladenosine tRNA methylthiotransferase n=1 Tax=Lotharella globosa TaxID=91324 RepID=A0A7S4DHF9_9EUKA|mmetsp:Transcript_30368/g.58484  ORF Transcript_30368/g.58484 Transcript_30368/m.58484 type:complete len:575 (+) Transcript_30368:1-1725(+)
MDDIEDLGKQDVVQREHRDAVVPKNFRRRGEQEPRPTDGVIPGVQTVYVKTWGCSHNNSDGEFMAGQLATYGYKIIQEKEKADLWVLNSCTVKAPSQDVFVNAIKAGKDQKKPMVLCGCVPQGEPDHPVFEGTSLLGVNQIDRIVEVAEETLKGHSVRLLSKRPKNSKLGPQGTLNLPKIRKNPLIEIISINSGCLNQCTYCKTKHARGDLISYPPTEIVQRAKLAIREGVREIWLTSEDTGTYGRDIGYSLPRLMQDLIDVTPPGVMLKIGMSNPPYFMEYLEPMAKILRHPRVYSVLHVPVQAGSDSVLARMKRKYTCEDFCKVVDYLLENVPEMSIHTDIICGFPGETVDDWKKTLDLVRKYEFPALHISQFYPRPGTPAAKMKRVHTKEVKRRSREMTELFSSYETHSEKKGKVYQVLATEIAKDKKHYVAHNKSYDQILVPMREDLLGQTFEVKIVGTGKFHLFGEVLESTVNSGKNPAPLKKGVPSGINKDWKEPSPKWEEERKKLKRKLRKLTQSDRATFEEETQVREAGEDHQGPAKSLIIAVIVALIAALYIRITTAQAAADARL